MQDTGDYKGMTEPLQYACDEHDYQGFEECHKCAVARLKRELSIADLEIVKLRNALATIRIHVDRAMPEKK